MKTLFIFILFSFIFFVGCKNPFAPALDPDGGTSGQLISDLSTPDGIFLNFQYSYTFKDTVIYGEFISPDFIFTYRDYESGRDISWGREDEMRSTYGLFQNSERIELIWNNTIFSSIDSVNANIVRGFNLTITFNPSDVIRINGRANFTLKKNNNKWQIEKWLDESNF